MTNDQISIRRIAVEVIHEWDVEVIALAEHEDGEGRSFLLTKSLDDEALPGYSISTEMGASTDGGMYACTLRKNELRITLTQEAADILGVPSNIVMKLEVPDAQLAQLRQGLISLLSLESELRLDTG